MTDKKQLNLGLCDADVVQRIQTAFERWKVDFMEDGYNKLNKKQFAVDFLEVVVPATKKWVGTMLSAKEAKQLAAKDVVRKRMQEDVNLMVRALMEELSHILSENIDNILEEVYGP